MLRALVAYCIAVFLLSCSGEDGKGPTQPAPAPPSGVETGAAASGTPDDSPLAYQRLYRAVGLRLSRATPLPEELTRRYLELPYQEGVDDAAVRDHNTAVLSQIDQELASASASADKEPATESQRTRRHVRDPFAPKRQPTTQTGSDESADAVGHERYRRLYQHVSRRLDAIEKPPRELVGQFLAIKYQSGIMNATLRAAYVDKLEAIDRDLTKFVASRKKTRTKKAPPAKGDVMENPFR